MYGIWRALGIAPHGFIVNALIKPSESQVANWNSKRKYGEAKGIVDYIKYSREPYLRTREDLERVERQLIDLCNEWERRILEGRFPLSNVTGACQLYNRKCDYHSACLAHDAPSEFEGMSETEDDYVLEDLRRDV